MSRFWNWTLGIALVAMMIAVPTIHYRSTYTHGKRLRPVAEGKLYRSGCLTSEGFRDAIAKYKIKTVINLQDEAPDPELRDHYFTLNRTKESELLKSLKVNYMYFPCELVYPRNYGKELPSTMKRFFDVMDNKDNYPVLLHCRAGLHRTGCVVAMYRQEYEGWSPQAALQELKNHGFGEFFSTSANPYIVQYILSYQPRKTGFHAGARSVPGMLTTRSDTPPTPGINSQQLPAGPPEDRGQKSEVREQKSEPLTPATLKSEICNLIMTLFDRLLIWNYIKSYLVCLVSLVGLFIVVDLFTNMDRFSEENVTVGGVLHQVARYYSIKVTQIFDRLCEPIVLCAAMFTVAWMQRNNEMLPLLSAGVSTRRIVRPVLFSAFLMLGLAILNQELVLPNIDWYYAENGRDPAGEKACFVQGAYEGNGIHISGNVGYRKELLIREFFVVIPAKINRDNITFLQSKEAHYIPPGTAELSGGWLLTQTTPAEIQGWSRTDILVPTTPGTYFLHTKEVDFDVITRPNSWFIYVSTLDLLKELGRTHNSKVAAVAVIFHMRLTRPILGMLLVFMGLSIILRDQNRNVFISAGMCLVLCGIFFMALFFCKSLGDREYLSPALAAWIPVGAFFPVSLVMFDAVHT